MPKREHALTQWLTEQIGLRDFRIEPASDDASFRRYFRLTLADGETRIAMDAPPEQEDCVPFLHIAAQLGAVGLHVPMIHAADPAQGFILLEDLGTVHYLDRMNEATADRLYGDALAALAVLQSVGPREGLPPYDAQLLRREMALFPDWLLGRHLELSLDAAEQALLRECFDLLVESALEQPRVCVHRDYHSRNLLLSESPSPGILDFQDAVLGPVTYDLVSLLKDCYIAWPMVRVQAWALGYFQLAVQSGVLQPSHEARFLRWFDLMGVQRHLKASGIFARLNHRDGKPGYLADIPRTLGYIVEVAGRYPELAGLGELIERRVLPRL
ncbi:aminoglycoside phosphotransferase family protein [Sedimenticola hydrogenitrophicus]|uniref:aminoglycoside phosphotransferase family protein n=1 Tax=Sedimenticola hydrogenitrophicus TaxID=2967975 RepID=UPI0021A5B43E|nr:phosphotransferase [Sedimenticola hydrogenitrophicus]